MACHGLILGQIDVRLPVFDTHAYRQRLGLHGDTGGVKHLEGIPRPVAQSEDHVLRRETVWALRARDFQSSHTAGL